MTGSVWWRQGIEYRDRCEQVRLRYEQTIEILKAREANTVEALRGHIEDLRQRIEAAKRRLESINGRHVGQAEIYGVIEILEDKT